MGVTGDGKTLRTLPNFRNQYMTSFLKMGVTANRFATEAGQACKRDEAGSLFSEGAIPENIPPPLCRSADRSKGERSLFAFF